MQPRHWVLFAWTAFFALLGLMAIVEGDSGFWGEDAAILLLLLWWLGLVAWALVVAILTAEERMRSRRTVARILGDASADVDSVDVRDAAADAAADRRYAP